MRNVVKTVACVFLMPFFILLVGTFTFFGFMKSLQAGGCYRPFVAASYASSYSYTPNYYYKEYIPYVLEVQVNRDRYYSLSDLYRDRLYLEAFDMMKEMRARMLDSNVGPAIKPQEQQPAAAVPPRTAAAPAPVSFGRTGAKAVAALNTHCKKCHDQGNPYLDLSNLDSVGMTKRWAAFGLIASGDMPPVPKEVTQKGAAEIQKWKAENALKETELQSIYNEWVMVGQLAKKP